MTDFDKAAADWDKDKQKIDRARAVSECIRKMVNITPEMTALEYGCGTGLLSFHLQPFFKHITLADNSSGMLTVLSEKISSAKIDNMSPLQADLLSDDLQERNFDIIYTMMTLHHIHPVQELFSRFFDLLSSNGYLCIVDLDKEDGSFHDKDFNGHHGFERKEMEKMAGSNGFKNIRFKTPFKIQKSVNGHEKTFSLFLMTAQK